MGTTNKEKKSEMTSCVCKGDSVILKVTQIEPKAKVQKTMKEMLGIKSEEEKPPEKTSKKKQDNQILNSIVL